jgi:hypothetical protein
VSGPAQQQNGAGYWRNRRRFGCLLLRSWGSCLRCLLWQRGSIIIYGARGRRSCRLSMCVSRHDAHSVSLCSATGSVHVILSSDRWARASLLPLIVWL